MRTELVVIGNEVLSGFTVNTNASFIGKELLNAGYHLDRQTVLSDKEEELKEGLKEAFKRSDLVITTGGLGPTIDDITRKAAASLFNRGFVFDKNVAKDLTARYGEEFPTIKDQSTVPEKTKVLINAVGTAPGFIFEESGKSMIMLPGVPNEMRPMLLNQAIPYILQTFPQKTKLFRKTLHIFEMGEHHLDPLLRELYEKYPQVDFGIYPSLGVVSIQLSARSKSESEAMAILDEPFSEIERNFATNCFQSPSGLLEEAVHHTFLENKWTLSLAESCTGGYAAAKLVKLAGASDYFLGSIVSYSNELKTKLLGVPEKMIEEFGAVSKEVAAKMVEGILKQTGSDFALAVTGIAGPTGGTPQKPVGTVWCAVCRQGEKPHTWKPKAIGSRDMIIERSVNSMFANLMIYTKETSLL